MKIGWNTVLLDQQPSGIGNYIEKTLKNINQLNKNHEISLFGTAEYEYSKIGFKSQSVLFNNIIYRNRFIRVLWEQTILPFKIKEYNCDIIHCPAHVVPLINSAKTVLTIHDLSFKLFPEAFKKTKRIYKNYIVPLSVKKADKIIAVSKNTKNNIIEEYNINPDKIQVIYNGVDDKYKIIKNTKLLNKIKEKYNLPNEFILYLGTLEPRKNIERLIKAYKIYLENNDSDEKLVIAGGKGWLYDNIFKLVKKENLENNILFTGYVSEEDIVSLYNLARIFVYPSLYEGFGLPPLEAMACGTPTITSNVSSLPEVVGNAALKIDPYDINELAKCIKDLLCKKELYNKHKKEGLERVKKFNWRKTAEKTLEVYEGLLK